MAYTYKAPQRDQVFLLPPSIADWLPEDHLVWFVLDVISMVDLTEFHKAHPNDGVGRRAYDPEMMLALLFFSYCTGLRSSRRIEAAVRSDLAFKAICCDLVPDHIAIARFRADHEAAITGAFIDILGLCARAGLVSLGTIAIDGTKIGSDAALDCNRTESVIQAEVDRILHEARVTDETEESEVSSGGNLPEVLAHRAGRLRRLRAALAEIESERQVQEEKERGQDARWNAEAKEGKRPRGPMPKRADRAVAKTEAELVAAVVRSEQAPSTLAKLQASEQVTRATRSLKAAKRAAACADVDPEAQANTTDPESRIMKTQSGWIQGYNAQAAVNEGQIVIAASVTQDTNDVAQLLPMIEAIIDRVARAGICEAIGTVLADAGYWSAPNATAPGPNRLIATTKDWKQRKAARELGTTTGPAPQGSSPLEAMEHRLRTPEGAAQYAKRSYTVEPIFGQAKENRGFRRFMRRGLSAATSEWALICATSNVLKLYTHADGRSLADVVVTAT